MDIMQNPMLFDLTTTTGFALALNEVRRLKEGGCLIVAICCESFSAMLPGLKATSCLAMSVCTCLFFLGTQVPSDKRKIMDLPAGQCGL